MGGEAQSGCKLEHDEGKREGEIELIEHNKVQSKIEAHTGTMQPQGAPCRHTTS